MCSLTVQYNLVSPDLACWDISAIQAQFQILKPVIYTLYDPDLLVILSEDIRINVVVLYKQIMWSLTLRTVMTYSARIFRPEKDLRTTLTAGNFPPG